MSLGSWPEFMAYHIAEAHRRRTADITVEDLMRILETQNGRCALTGVEMTRTTHDPTKASIDRIDSAKGYTLDNVRLVTWMANKIKSNLTDQQVVYWAHLISEKHRDQRHQSLVSAGVRRRMRFPWHGVEKRNLEQRQAPEGSRRGDNADCDDGGDADDRESDVRRAVQQPGSPVQRQSRGRRRARTNH